MQHSQQFQPYKKSYFRINKQKIQLPHTIQPNMWTSRRKWFLRCDVQAQIPHLWDLLECRLCITPHYLTSMPNFTKAIVAEWALIPSDMLQNLVKKPSEKKKENILAAKRWTKCSTCTCVYDGKKSTGCFVIWNCKYCSYLLVVFSSLYILLILDYFFYGLCKCIQHTQTGNTQIGTRSFQEAWWIIYNTINESESFFICSRQSHSSSASTEGFQKALRGYQKVH